MGTICESVLTEISHHSRAGEFFKSLSTEAFEDCESLESLSCVAAGAILFAEDQAPSEIFILLRCQVKLTINSGDGKRFILRIAKPGDFLGLTSAFTGEPHTRTAETLYPCTIASIQRSDFLEFLRRHPAAYPSVASTLSLDSKMACARLRTIGLGSSSRAKLARLLLEWCADGRQTEQGIRLHLSLSHGEIAEFIGVTRETVSRNLNKFRRRRLVELCGATLTISNRAALEECASRGSRVPMGADEFDLPQPPVFPRRMPRGEPRSLLARDSFRPPLVARVADKYRSSNAD